MATIEDCGSGGLHIRFIVWGHFLKICDYYSPIPILSPFLFTLSLYATILNPQDFSFALYKALPCFVIGIDEILAHYACTFENSNLHFHFQF